MECTHFRTISIYSPSYNLSICVFTVGEVMLDASTSSVSEGDNATVCFTVTSTGVSLDRNLSLSLNASVGSAGIYIIPISS